MRRCVTSKHKRGWWRSGPGVAILHLRFTAVVRQNKDQGARRHQPPPALSVTSCIRVRSRLPRFWKSVHVTLTTSSTRVLIMRQLIWKYWDHILTTAITRMSHDSEILEVRLIGQYLQLKVKTFFLFLSSSLTSLTTLCPEGHVHFLPPRSLQSDTTRVQIAHICQTPWVIMQRLII